MTHSSPFSNVFRDMFDNATVGIFQTTPDGRYIRVNGALASMYGYPTPEDMIERLTNIGGQLYTAPDRRAEFIGALEAEGAVQHFESEIRRTDGSLMWISEDARIVYAPDGAPLYYEGFVRNVTERRRLREELAVLNASLEERVENRTRELALENQRRKLAEIALTDALKKANAAVEAKARFLANVSHELRTPLNAIIGFADVMDQEIMGPMENPSYKGYTGDILSSGQHLLHLINEILDLSKIESGTVELSCVKLDVNEILEECVVMLDVKAREKDIRLLHTKAKAPVVVCGDGLRLKQIFLNIMSNAVKFSPEGGQIVLSAHMDGAQTAVVRVTDEGPGLAPEDIPKVFEEYGQADHGLDNALEGTGLGLPISRRLARLHGGELTLESRLGQGTTAVVTLPVTPKGG